MLNESLTSYQFELLDSQNWFSWKTKMEAYLEEHDLEDVVAKDGPMAAIPGTPTAVEAKAIADWKKKDAKARSRMLHAIAASEMVHVRGAKTAKAMWEQLRSIKESRGNLWRLSVRVVSWPSML